MKSLLQDVRYGLRMLLKAPVFATLIVLSLALGIGANSAIFSTINAVMLRTLPVHDPRSLYLLQWTKKSAQIDPFINDLEGDEDLDEHTGWATSYSFSYPAYQRIQKDNAAFSAMFAFAANEEQANFGLDGTASSGVVQGISGNLFAGLGVSPILGRTILPSDDDGTAAPVAVASYAFWQAHMGGEPGAIGKTIAVNGTPLTIVGVAPAEFLGPDPRVAPDLWIPLVGYAREWDKSNLLDVQGSLLSDDKTWWLGVVGRLRPDVSTAEAVTGMSVLFDQSIRAYTPTLPAGTDLPQLKMMSAARGLNSLREEFSKSLLLLLGMVGLVLLMACANVAGLLMARGASRQREIAVRISLGATKARIIRQVLTESVLLGVMGGAAALVIAQRASRLLVGLLASGRDPVHLAVHIDARVLAFTAAVSILSGIAFGLAPSLAAIRVQPLTTLKESSGTASAGAKRFRSGKMLVGAQVALSLLLLICAGVLLRSLQSLERVNLGFDRRSVVLFTVRPGLNGYGEQRLASYYEELRCRVKVIPGVRAVSFAQRNPIGQGSSVGTVEVPGYTPGGKHISAWRHVVAAGYFDTLKIPVLLGRALGEQDTSSSVPVVVINQTFAKKYFHGDNPLGRELQFGSRVQPRPMQIVGVAGDVKYGRIREDAPPTVYVAYTQSKGVSPFMTYELRISGAKAPIIRSIENEALALNPDVPVVNLTTEDEIVDQVLYLERTFAMLSSAFCALALALACVGIYGTVAYTVAQRTNEIGIRMALGAERGKLLRMVLQETLMVVGAGLAAGLPLAWLGTRMLTAQVYGISPHDPLTSFAAVLAISAVTVVAGAIPAVRASQIEPIQALRYE
jgi:predicted permease